jgi:hypothetical protein
MKNDTFVLSFFKKTLDNTNSAKHSAPFGAKHSPNIITP